MTPEHEAVAKQMAQQARQNAVMLASQGLPPKSSADTLIAEAAKIEAFILTGIVPTK